MKNYKIIQTDDGSQTLYSNIYGEACHSTSGAVEETNTHYIQGCQLARKLQSADKLCVLEVGFGTGIGFKQTRKFLKDKVKFHFVSFEIDPDLVEYFSENEGIEFVKKDNIYIFEQQDLLLEVITGNARDTVMTLPNMYFDAIYQDAFSPKKNATLWTKQWFDQLKRVSKQSCHMSTYSSSSSIRKSMLAAGWILSKGVKFGPKRSSTRASLNGFTDKDILLQLSRSPAPLITDDNYQDYQDGKL